MKDVILRILLTLCITVVIYSGYQEFKEERGNKKPLTKLEALELLNNIKP